MASKELLYVFTPAIQANINIEEEEEQGKITATTT